MISYVLLVRKGAPLKGTGNSFGPNAVKEFANKLRLVGALDESVQGKPVDPGNNSLAPDPYGPPEDVTPDRCRYTPNEGLGCLRKYDYQEVTWWELGERKKPRSCGPGAPMVLHIQSQAHAMRRPCSSDCLRPLFLAGSLARAAPHVAPV